MEPSSLVTILSSRCPLDRRIPRVIVEAMPPMWWLLPKGTLARSDTVLDSDFKLHMMVQRCLVVLSPMARLIPEIVEHLFVQVLALAASFKQRKIRKLFICLRPSFLEVPLVALLGQKNVGSIDFTATPIIDFSNLKQKHYV